MKKILLLLAAALVLLSCGSEIAYREARNYFFRNDAAVPQNPVVNSQAEMDSLFGCATTMGPDGKPTAIDFEKEFVVAIVLPETSHATTIVPGKMLKQGDELVFTYHLDRAAEDAGYTMRPIYLAIVGRDGQAPRVTLREE